MKKCFLILLQREIAVATFTFIFILVYILPRKAAKNEDIQKYKNAEVYWATVWNTYFESRKKKFKNVQLYGVSLKIMNWSRPLTYRMSCFHLKNEIKIKQGSNFGSMVFEKIFIRKYIVHFLFLSKLFIVVKE